MRGVGAGRRGWGGGVGALSATARPARITVQALKIPYHMVFEKPLHHPRHSPTAAHARSRARRPQGVITGIQLLVTGELETGSFQGCPATAATTSRTMQGALLNCPCEGQASAAPEGLGVLGLGPCPATQKPRKMVVEKETKLPKGGHLPLLPQPQLHD